MSSRNLLVQLFTDYKNKISDYQISSFSSLVFPIINDNLVEKLENTGIEMKRIQYKLAERKLKTQLEYVKKEYPNQEHIALMEKVIQEELLRNLANE
jgi:hypothetical protein